jgi:Family of unknown function (DUF6151)
MHHLIACQCGIVKGYLVCSGQENRGICYCTDCQAFAKYLGQDSVILDNAAGTEIVQTLAEFLHITEGKERLACIKLTDNGLLRWYSNCCNTPIANTPDNYKNAFVGLVHACLTGGNKALDASFGKLKMAAFTDRATSNPKPKTYGVPSAMLRIIAMLLKARIFGAYKKTPFFDVQTGKPVAIPKVLGFDELKDLKAKQ